MDRPEGKNAYATGCATAPSTAALPELTLSERDRRWSKVRQLMERDGIDAIVTSPNPHQLESGTAYTRYLSQIGGNGTVASVVFPREGEVAAVVPPVPGPERLGAAYGWIGDLRDIGLDWAYAGPIVTRLRELSLERGRIGVCGLRGQIRAPEGTFIHGIYEGLRTALPQAELTDATDLLNEARYVKSDEEIAALRVSVRNAEAMIERMVQEARPGVPENVVYGRMISTLIERGGEIPTLLLWSAGQTQGRNLFLPPPRPLEAGDIITVEVEGRFMGYQGQVTTHAFLGKVPQQYREMHAFQQEVIARCYQRLKPGAVLGDFAELARESAEGSGFDCRLVMHGRGLGDDPPIAIFGVRDQGMANWPILQSSVFIVKPRVSIGEPAGHDATRFVYWGDTVVATETGAERLGSLPPELIEIL